MNQTADFREGLGMITTKHHRKNKYHVWKENNPRTYSTINCEISGPLDRGHFLIPGVNIAKLSQNGPISEFKWTPIWTEGYFWKRTSTNHQGKLSQNGPNKCSEAASRREGSWIKGVEITTQGVQNRNEIVANSTWSSSSREGCSKTASRSDNLWNWSSWTMKWSKFLRNNKLLVGTARELEFEDDDSLKSFQRTTKFNNNEFIILKKMN